MLSDFLKIILSSADFSVLFMSFFSKIYFRNNIRMSNRLDPDQARRFVGPDLGPNCLQMLSTDDIGRGERVSGGYL